MPRRTEIAELIRKKLILNEFKPGESIPEESLAAEFGVSRTPVREALLLLEGQRLVSIQMNRGATVASVSVAWIRSFFEAAGTIYSEVVGRAAGRATDEQLAEMQAVLDEFRAGVGNFEIRTLAGVRLMDLIGSTCQNDFLADTARILTGYHYFVTSNVARNLPVVESQKAAEEEALHFDNILKAMSKRNESVAAEMVRHKLDASRVFLISNFI